MSDFLKKIFPFLEESREKLGGKIFCSDYMMSWKIREECPSCGEEKKITFGYEDGKERIRDEQVSCDNCGTVWETGRYYKSMDSVEPCGERIWLSFSADCMNPKCGATVSETLELENDEQTYKTDDFLDGERWIEIEFACHKCNSIFKKRFYGIDIEEAIREERR